MIKRKSVVKWLTVSLIGTVLLAGCSSSNDTMEGSSTDIKKISEKDAKTELASYVKKIDAKEASLVLDINGNETNKTELPDINEKYPLAVEGKNEVNAEIFVSPEKAGSGKDDFLIEAAKKFNDENHQVDGKTVSISIRPLASGTGLDYISTENYVPDAYTPSNNLWGKMLQSRGVSITTQEERLAGNTAGLLMKPKVYDDLKQKYKEINVETLIKAVKDDHLLLGYTNPYSSSTGLNLLTQLLTHFDSSNPLSEKSVQDLQAFQTNLPTTAYTTVQLRESAKSGNVDAMAMEYQTYINTPELKQYKFVPLGIRHDSPIYTIDHKAKEGTAEVIKSFCEFVTSEEQQKKATENGFNALDEYQPAEFHMDGTTIEASQLLWKENKNSGKPIIAVFVADVSGSMEGAPINSLKESLMNGSKYIKDDTYIGLVSYGSKVTIDLPIAQMTSKQRGYFTGAVRGLSANGGTATYNATLVGLDMVAKQLEKTPDAKPVIFVLSDGAANEGYTFDKTAPIIKGLGISINTIGYNADLKELEKLSSINESATINADQDDVMYQLKNLFNAEL